MRIRLKPGVSLSDFAYGSSGRKLLPWIPYYGCPPLRQPRGVRAAWDMLVSFDVYRRVETTQRPCLYLWPTIFSTWCQKLAACTYHTNNPFSYISLSPRHYCIPYLCRPLHSASWIPTRALISPQRALWTPEALIAHLEIPKPPLHQHPTKPSEHSGLKLGSLLCSTVSQPSCEFSSGNLHVLLLDRKSTSGIPQPIRTSCVGTGERTAVPA